MPSLCFKSFRIAFLTGAGFALMQSAGFGESMVGGVKYDAVVADDGSGTYTNLQSAIAAVPDEGTNWFTIFIKPGTYEGQFLISKKKPHLHLVGADVENTILDWPYNVYDRNLPGKYPFDPGMIVVGNDFIAENLTIQNSSGDRGQALALRLDGDRAVFNHCRILGWQDTLMANNGRQYFTNCYVAGRVDFIYGSGTAVFDHCEIHSRNGGYVTAASTPPERAFGYVFLDCHLTGDSQPWVNPTNHAPMPAAKKAYAELGRPWRPFASVTYLNCKMDDHIRPAGWNNWGNVTNETTARYAEYHSTGPGAKPDQRVKWAKQLTDAEAAAMTVQAILGGTDEWVPWAVK